MHPVLEFPSKTFIQWGAIAQEIGPYLAQRGASKEEIRAVIDRVRIRWEQLEPRASAQDPGPPTADDHDAAQASGKPEEHDIYASRHWRSQPARTLIESAGAEFQRRTGG